MMHEFPLKTDSSNADDHEPRGTLPSSLTQIHPSQRIKIIGRSVDLDNLESAIELCSSAFPGIYDKKYIKEELTAFVEGRAVKGFGMEGAVLIQYKAHYDEGGGLIAVSGLYSLRENADTAALGWFVVREDLRGRGIGTRILASSEDAARSLGFKNIEVYSDLRATEFYKKLGYTLTSNLAWDDSQDIAHMQKSL